MDNDPCLDLPAQQITDLTLFAQQYSDQLPYLTTLNLSDNKITEVPLEMTEQLALLEVLNLNNNKIDNVFEAIDAIAVIPTLKSLFINLNKEEQVDYILKKLPTLDYLNGLQVDRDELYGADNNEVYEELQPKRMSRNGNDNGMLMMTEIRETVKEDYNNTQPLNEHNEEQSLKTVLRNDK